MEGLPTILQLPNLFHPSRHLDISGPTSPPIPAHRVPGFVPSWFDWLIHIIPIVIWDPGLPMGKSCLSHITVIPFSLNLPVPCIVGLMTYLINYPKLTKKWLLGGSLGKTTECSTFFSSWVLNTLRNKQNSGIVKVAQSCLTLCNHMDCIVHGILHAIILEWVAFPFSRGSCQPRDRTQVCPIAGRFFTSWATREAQNSGRW